jgi:hypothetical protein
MKKCFIFLLTGLLLLANFSILPAADLEFDSFAEAEAAAKKRAEEYQKKMDEHLKEVKENWEKQQKDLGESGNTPDITDITSSSDGNKSSDSDAQKNMEDAVNSSVNKMKDMMIKSATPNTTGFAGGGAGYQWSVKFVNGKYILSDSYNEAAFGTGDKNDDEPEPEPAEPEKIASGEDDDEDMVVADKPGDEPDGPAAEPTTPSTPSSGDSSGSSSSTGTPGAPTTSGKPADGTAPSGGDPSAPAAPGTPADKPLPGVDPAPTKLPEPDVRMVIQHPTDFTEDFFSTNTDNEAPVEYSLNKFKIPEDTRVKIALEISKDIDPSKVALVITDEEGKNPPVDSNKTKNYRHMFRVPSDDKYSAAVIIKEGGNTKELMKVTIPVIKVDFDSRTIDDQRRKLGSEGLTNSSTTSHSSSEGDFNHSTFGKSQQVDLSDMYSDPSAEGNNSSNSQGNSSGSQSSGDFSSDASSAYDSSSDASNNSGNDPEGNSNANSSGSSSSSSSGDDASGSDSSASNQGNGENDGNISDDSSQEDGSSNQGSSASAANANEESSEYANAGGTNHDYSNSDQSGNSGSEAHLGGNRQGDSSSGSSSEEDESLSGDQQGANETDGSRVRGSADHRSGSSFADNPDTSADKIRGGMAGAQNTVSEGQEDKDPFVMALSMQAVSRKIYQSFDFIEEKSPVSAEIPAGTEITFSMSFSSNVDPNSVRIELNDGNGKVTGDLKTWGEAFAYVFSKPATAYFVVSGTAEKTPFTYRLNIPVK